jgi:hypothetical protein
MSEGDPKREQDEPAVKAPDGSDIELDEDAKAVLDEHQGREEGGLDEVDVRELLRSALAPPPGAVAPELLRGVQRRIRKRSRGKFYGDGWSTTRSPRSTYLITSILMLFLIGIVYFVLVPWGGGALR